MTERRYQIIQQALERPILHVVRIADGGMRRHLELLISGLSRRGLRVAMAGTLGDIAVPGVPSFEIDVLDGIDVRRDFGAVARLRHLMSSSDWSLLHAHGWKAGMVALLARFPSRRPPLVLTLHNELSPRFAGWRRWLIGQALDLPLRYSDALICVSSQLQQTVEARCRSSAAKLTKIQNGIDLASLERIAASATTSSQERDDHRYTVGTVSRMIPEKGISDLLRAFVQVRPRIPGVVLSLVGDGPNRQEFENEARQLGLGESVVFHGWRSDATELMSYFDVFVLPSWSEGTPLTVMEAMALGRPVIATDVGGVRDLVTHMQTGVLVAPRSPEAIADAIESLLGDPALRSQLSRKAREHALTSFGCETMIDKTIQVYASVLD
jgi:glycosyltransferase involved in cell wall biosynthesis